MYHPHGSPFILIHRGVHQNAVPKPLAGRADLLAVRLQLVCNAEKLIQTVIVLRGLLVGIMTLSIGTNLLVQPFSHLFCCLIHGLVPWPGSNHLLHQRM